MSEEKVRYNTEGLADLSLGIAAQCIDDLLNARALLRHAVEDLGRVILEDIEGLRVAELKTLAGTQARDLAEGRVAVATLFVDKSERKAELEAAEITFVLTWKAANAGSCVDPATGKTNATHTAMVLAEAMGINTEIERLRRYAAEAEDMYRLRLAQVDGLADQLAATKAAVYLTAAELNLLAGPVQGLAGLAKLVDGGG